MNARRHGSPQAGPSGVKAPLGAFTLLEVLIAMGLFFLAVFAILDATNQSLRAARSLQINLPDASVFAANLYLTNRLEEGREPLNFAEAYGSDRIYPGWSCIREIRQIETNGLFQVDFIISGTSAGHAMVFTNSLLLWRPQSALSVPGLRRGR